MANEVQNVRIQAAQARINEIRKADPNWRNDPAKLAEVEKLTKAIRDALTGKTEAKIDGNPVNIEEATNLSISEEMGFKAKNKPADKAKTDAMAEYARDGHGDDKDAARKKVKEEFGAGAVSKEQYKAAKKEIDELQKEIKNLRKKGKDAAAADKPAIQKQIAEKQAELKKKQEAFVETEARYYGNSDKFAKKFEKAAHQNVEQYEETQAKAKELGAKVKMETLSDRDQNTILSAYTQAAYRLEEAQKAGDEDSVKAIKEQYADELGFFAKGEDGEVDFTEVDTAAVQRYLARMSGGDQNFNIDEKQVLADDLMVAKKDVKSLAKTFGFGIESGASQRARVALAEGGAAAVGNLLNHVFFGKKTAHDEDIAYGKAGKTVRGEVTWADPHTGEVFHKTYEAQGGAGGVAKAVADACAKIPIAGQFVGPVLAGVTAGLLTKPQAQDIFNGANVEEVLDNLQVTEREAQPVLQQIKDMEITGDPQRDKAIKAAVIKGALGEDTKAANLRELSAAFVDLKKVKDVMGQIDIEVKPEEPVKPQDTEPEKPNLDIEDETTTETVRTNMPRLPLREGTWYTSHGYVDEEGKPLSEADRKLVQAALNKDENRIALTDDKKNISLPNEIELPNGKKVKLAPDAHDRIMKLPAKGGGKNGKYATAVEYDKTTHKYYVVNKQTGKRISQGFDTRNKAETKRQEFLDKPDTIPKDK